MGGNSIENFVLGLSAPVLAENGFDLVDIEYKKEGNRFFLRVFIHKPGGVTLKDCQKISYKIEDIIEIENIIKGNYILEVSSPGLDRPLKSEKDFLRNLNNRVCISTHFPIKEQSAFFGTIENVKDGILYLKLQKEVFSIPICEIKKAILEIKF